MKRKLIYGPQGNRQLSRIFFLANFHEYFCQCGSFLPSKSIPTYSDVLQTLTQCGKGYSNHKCYVSLIIPIFHVQFMSNNYYINEGKILTNTVRIWSFILITVNSIFYYAITSYFMMLTCV